MGAEPLNTDGGGSQVSSGHNYDPSGPCRGGRACRLVPAVVFCRDPPFLQYPPTRSYLVLICDQCAAPIPAGARFCPACGDPVTAADEAASLPVMAVERVQLVCPKCKSQAAYDIPSHGVATVACPHCQAAFHTRVVRVQSKRSRGDKRSSSREFTVRVKDLAGRDDLIEFRSPFYDDFELKSRDLAAFSVFEGKLHVVQNLTVGRFIVVATDPFGCPAGCIVAAVVFMLFALLIAAVA